MKQQANFKSPIKDINDRLNSVRQCFNPLYSLFSPGSRLVDLFSGRITFYSPSSSSNEDLHQHLQSLEHTFRLSQINNNNTAIITDGGIKKSQVAIAITHIWSENHIIKSLKVHSINITSLEAKLMAIHTGLVPTMEIEDIHNITIIIDSIAVAKKILESKVDLLQNMFIPLTSAIKTFFSKNSRNKINFWYCPSKAKWPRHQLVDNQIKTNTCLPVFPSKESHLFNKKKECNNILYE